MTSFPLWTWCIVGTVTSFKMQSIGTFFKFKMHHVDIFFPLLLGLKASELKNLLSTPQTKRILWWVVALFIGKKVALEQDIEREKNIISYVFFNDLMLSGEKYLYF